MQHILFVMPLIQIKQSLFYRAKLLKWSHANQKWFRVTHFPKGKQDTSGSCGISGTHCRNEAIFKKKKNITIYREMTEWEPKCRTFQLNPHCAGSVEIYSYHLCPSYYHFSGVFLSFIHDIVCLFVCLFIFVYLFECSLNNVYTLPLSFYLFCYLIEVATYWLHYLKVAVLFLHWSLLLLFKVNIIKFGKV